MIDESLRISHPAKFGSTGLIASLAVGSLALFGSVYLRQPDYFMIDLGTVAAHANAITQGQVVHRDFVHSYAGAFVLLIAFLYNVLWPSLWLILFPIAVGVAMTVHATWLLATQLFDRHVALAVAVASGLFIMHRFTAYPGLIAYPLGLYAIAILFGQRRSALLAGLLIGLAGVFKETYGIYFLLAGVLTLFMNAAPTKDTPVYRFAPGVAITAIAAITLLPLNVRILDVAVVTGFVTWIVLAIVQPLAVVLKRGASVEAITDLFKLFIGASAAPLALFLYLASQNALTSYLQGLAHPDFRADITLYLPISSLLSSCVVLCGIAAFCLHGWQSRANHPSNPVSRRTIQLIFVVPIAVVLVVILVTAEKVAMLTSLVYLPFMLVLLFLFAGAPAHRRRDFHVVYCVFLVQYMMSYPIAGTGYAVYALAALPLAVPLLFATRRHESRFLPAFVILGLAMAYGIYKWDSQFQHKLQGRPFSLFAPTSTFSEKWAHILEPVKQLALESKQPEDTLVLPNYYYLYAFIQNEKLTALNLQDRMYWMSRHPFSPAQAAQLRDELSVSDRKRIALNDEHIDNLLPLVPAKFTQKRRLGSFLIFEQATPDTGRAR